MRIAIRVRVLIFYLFTCLSLYDCTTRKEKIFNCLVHGHISFMGLLFRLRIKYFGEIAKYVKSIVHKNDKAQKRSFSIA